MALIGGSVGYRLLKLISDGSKSRLDGSVYSKTGKLAALLGPTFFDRIQGQVVIDFGCGTGAEAVEMAQKGARKVIGIDIQEEFLAIARDRAVQAGVADKCEFGATASEPADVIIAIDSFEHFEDPASILATMRTMIKPTGRVLASFGPTWYHPLGGHLFSVFPWAHLVFTEKALLRWRSEFKTDGARRFSEVDGGLNGMTVHRFRRLVSDSGCRIAQFEAVPIRRLRYLHLPFTREFFTSVVRCTLEQAAIRDDRMEISVERPHAEPQAGNTSDDLHQHVG